MGFVWHLYSIHSMIHSRLCSYFIHVVWWNTTRTRTHALAQDASINISYQYYVFYVQILTVTHNSIHTCLPCSHSVQRRFVVKRSIYARWAVGGVCKYANSPKCNILLFNQISHKAPKANFNENTRTHASISKIQNGLCVCRRVRVRVRVSKCV